MMIDDEHDADSCGCCADGGAITPEAVENRPGLSAVRYRVGTFASFQQSMLQEVAATALAATSGAPRAAMTVRRAASTTHSLPIAEVDDYGSAVVGMWAYLADVLTFYQERIVNEAFLRTARSRESLIRLAGLIDYKPAPGAAAVAHLAFTTEKGKSALIPPGLLVQSVPGSGQDEKPQKFETIGALSAEEKLTRVRVFPEPTKIFKVKSLPRVTMLNEAAAVVENDKLVVWQANKYAAEKTVVDVRFVDWRTELTVTPPLAPPDQPPLNNLRWQKWRRKFRLFGHNVPSTYLATYSTGSVYRFEPAKFDHTKAALGNTIVLEGLFSDINVGCRLLIVSQPPGQIAALQLVTVARVAQREMQVKAEDFKANQDPFPPPEDHFFVPFLSATASEVEVKEQVGPLNSLYTVIYELQEPTIAIWNYTYPPSRPGNTIFLHCDDLGLDEAQARILLIHRRVIVGDSFDKCEVVTITDCELDRSSGVDHFKLTLDHALPTDPTMTLDATTTVLYGNVVKATHGESVRNEILGNGDASLEFQEFTLRKKPVTYVSAPGASRGAASTLEIHVDGIRWSEVRSFYGQPADARVFVTSFSDDGDAYVRFGDGKNGARVPTGRNNVVASYRQGIGASGNVRGKSLTTLLRRPVGLASVINPQAAVGGVDAETLDEIRRNAPNSVRTFGRIVSLRDFEDAAREFTGVAKARAVARTVDAQQEVRLIVAGVGGLEVKGPLLEALIADLNSRRDAQQLMRVESYVPVPIKVVATVVVDPRHIEDVVAAASATLLNRLRFDNLELGQAIFRSKVSTVLQRVSGVVAVDLDVLSRINKDDPAGRTLEDVILNCNEVATLEAIDLKITAGAQRP